VLCICALIADCATATSRSDAWSFQQLSSRHLLVSHPSLLCFLCFLLCSLISYTHTHTHTRLTALFPGLPGWASTRKVKPIWISGKTNLDFTEARDSEWQWHQLGPMQVCISLQTDNHASTTPLKVFYRPDALPAAQPTASKHWLVNSNYLHISLIFLDWQVELDTFLTSFYCIICQIHITASSSRLSLLCWLYCGHFCSSSSCTCLIIVWL